MTTTTTDIIFPDKDWAAADPQSQNVDPQKLDEAMQCFDDITAYQGTRQAMVIRRGRLLWQGDDIDNFHIIWSCTKSFTSMAFGLLFDDGKCSPETLACDIVPELKEHYPTITLKHLATFTSGYNGGKTPFDPAAPAYKPGEFFRYDGSSEMLAHILTQIAGEPLKDLFARRIAEPIGMNPAAWNWGDFGEVKGIKVNGGSGMYDKGIFATAREIARVGHMIVSKGLWNGQRILSEEWIEQSTSPQVDNTVPPFNDKDWYVKLPGSYGLNWWTNGCGSTGEPYWPAAPAKTCAIQGNMNNICLIVPEWDMVIVRLACDARIDMDLYDKFFQKMSEAILDAEH